MTDAVPRPPERVRTTWLRRSEAEYASAALSLQLAHWLTEIAGPPELIYAAMDIARDEFGHARHSTEVARAAGATAMPQIDRSQLSAPRDARHPVEEDLLSLLLRSFCVGETLAVPLFREMRAGSSEPAARAVLDLILVDEARHREYAWIALEWLLADHPALRDAAARLAPAIVRRRVDACSTPLDRILGDTVTPEERSWGLISAGSYRTTVLAALEREVWPRFARLGVARDDARSTA